MQPRVLKQFGCGGTRFWLYFQAPQHEGVPTLQLIVGKTVLGRLSLLHHEHGALEGKIFSFSTSQEVTCDSVSVSSSIRRVRSFCRARSWVLLTIFIKVLVPVLTALAHLDRDVRLEPVSHISKLCFLDVPCYPRFPVDATPTPTRIESFSASYEPEDLSKTRRYPNV